MVHPGCLSLTSGVSDATSVTIARSRTWIAWEVRLDLIQVADLARITCCYSLPFLAPGAVLNLNNFDLFSHELFFQ